MPAGIEYYDEDHGGSANAMYSFVSMMAFGAVLGSRGFTGFGPGVTTGVDATGSNFISWEVQRMSNAEAINLAARVAQQAGPVLSVADEQLIADTIAQRMLNQGISSAGCVFFPSGL